MLQFLNSLLSDGLASVSLGVPLPMDASELAPLLHAMDERRRPHLAGAAPVLDEAAAAWAAQTLFKAARLLVARDVDGEAVTQAFQAPYPGERNAATDYSVDLLLCHLPQLHHLARRIAPGDPLIGQLEGLGQAWPLSSVGMSDVTEVKVESFIHHPCLRQLYVDRILATKDVSRLQGHEVCEAAREALGAYPELCPEVAARLDLKHPVE